MINVYTDGSFNRAKKLCSYGYVILDDHNNIIHEGKGKISEEFYAKHWNVGGEIAAVLEAVKICVTEGFKDITIYHDYNGVGYWGNGTWKTNTPLTKYYKDTIQQYKKEFNLRIQFKWVKGHSGNKWNEYVDKLAGEALK